MTFDKRDMIDKLKMEISLIRDGAYNPSVREPRKQPRIFRDSITCLNVALEEKKEPCSNCFLIELVPPALRHLQEPCHHIPLNEDGDTVASLQAEGDQDKLEAALLGWLHRTIAKLQREVLRGTVSNAV